MIDTEQQQLRQQYLAAMGVTLWLPRQPLPGAAPSPLWRWQQTAPDRSSGLKPAAPERRAVDAGLNTETQHPAERGRGAADSRPHPAPLRQLLQGAVAATASPPELDTQAAGAMASSRAAESLAAVSSATAALNTVTPNTVPSNTAASVPRFRLAMISYSDCLVVTELPISQHLPWSGQHQQLLNAVVRAVGLGGDAQLTNGVREFIWPLDPQARFDQSAPIARHALQVELTAVRQDRHRVLLLMGAQAAEYLLPLEQVITSGQWVESQELPTLCCHGLHEVLRLPGLKAELWRQLQPLRSLADGR